VSIRSFKRAQARRFDRERRRAVRLTRRGGMVAGLALSASTLMVANAQADTYTVTTSADDNGSTAACTAVGTSTTDFTCLTLRDAITQANSDSTNNNSATDDTISFDPSVTGTITLGGASLPITGNHGLTITGPGSSSLTISGNDASQIFSITAPTGNNIAISGLTITHGSSSTPGGAIVDVSNGLRIGPGGASGAALSLTDDVISDSTTTVSSRSGPYSGPGGGGGIYSRGPVTLTDSTVSGNTATSAPGGGLSLSAKYSGGPSGTNTISGSTISDNHAASGGGIQAGTKYSSYGPSPYSLLEVGRTTITKSQITGNAADQDSGSGSSGFGGGVNANESLSLTSSKVSGNTATSVGGGVNLFQKYGGDQLTGDTISDNQAAPPSGSTSSTAGGGVGVWGIGTKYAPVNVNQSTVSGNQATAGAGIDVLYDFNSAVDINSSTVSANTGVATTHVPSAGGGLGVANVGGKFTVTDSTLSGNTADEGAGALLGEPNSSRPTIQSKYNSDGSVARQGSIAFNNSTISGNTATTHGGGIYDSAYKTYTSTGTPEKGAAWSLLESTIVGANKAGGSEEDLYRLPAATSGGFAAAFSLIQNPNGVPLFQNHNVLGKDPQLNGLANNGGPTETMKPKGTSPVIDQGHGPGIGWDQRGPNFFRTVDTAIPNPAGGDGTDIGSVELTADEVVVPPKPPATQAGFSVSVNGASLGGSGRPLIGNRTPGRCSVKTGTLNSCVIEVRSSGKLLASGEATASGSTKSLTVYVHPTNVGSSQLRKHKLGVNGTATAVGSDSVANGSPKATGKVHLLDSPITFQIGGRSKSLSKGLLGSLDKLAKLLTGAKTVTCTAYTNKGKQDNAITKAQASKACSKLKAGGVKGKTHAVGAGHSKRVASNKTAKGRRANRRLVISFRF
jgi:hypothetical protein